MLHSELDNLLFRTEDTKHIYFGYYDKSPLDKGGNRLLCLRSSFADRLPEVDDVAEIGYWDIQKKIFYRLGETRAFNFQQGCMLQWLGPDYARHIIYNDREDDRFVSIILDIETQERKVIPFPVYTVHPSGKYAVSVDFERHYFPRRSYAYAGIERSDKNQRVVEGDGLYCVDLETGDVNTIVTVHKMLERNHLSSMDGGVTYLEHAMFSPTGNRFIFYHRWELEDGGFYTRLYTSDIKGEDIRCVLDSGKATHSCWKGDTEITVWGALPTVLHKLRRKRKLLKLIFKPLLPIYHQLIDPRSKLALTIASTNYLICADEENGSKKRLTNSCLGADGHPSWNPVHEGWMLTDTYPDREGYQNLYLYNIDSDQCMNVGKFTVPPEIDGTGYRCDLHPRWNYDGNLVCIDSQHTGVRQMYVFDFKEYLNKAS